MKSCFCFIIIILIILIVWLNKTFLSKKGREKAVQKDVHVYCKTMGTLSNTSITLWHHISSVWVIPVTTISSLPEYHQGHNAPSPLHLKLYTTYPLDLRNSWVCQQIDRRLKAKRWIESAGKVQMSQWHGASCSPYSHLCRCHMWRKPSEREPCFTERMIDSKQLCMVTGLSTGPLITNETTMWFTQKLHTLIYRIILTHAIRFKISLLLEKEYKNKCRWSRSGM